MLNVAVWQPQCGCHWCQGFSGIAFFGDAWSAPAGVGVQNGAFRVAWADGLMSANCSHLGDQSRTHLFYIVSLVYAECLAGLAVQVYAWHACALGAITRHTRTLPVPQRPHPQVALCCIPGRYGCLFITCVAAPLCSCGWLLAPASADGCSFFPAL